MKEGSTVYIGGIPHEVLASKTDVDGDILLIVRRPKGHKQYLARMLPDHPLYGELRAQRLHDLPF